MRRWPPGDGNGHWGAGLIHGFPLALPGQRIGILGGSFDPPHAGHVQITQRALRRLKLDRVWWMVSPGNPLKREEPAQIERRMAACRAMMQHPRVIVSDVEARLGTRFTADTLQKLMTLYPGVHFVWLMGADNLAGFHHWDQWQWIMENVPVGVLSRPGEQLRAGLSPTALRYARYRLPITDAGALAQQQAPAWTLLSGPMVEISSTELRAKGHWMR